MYDEERKPKIFIELDGASVAKIGEDGELQDHLAEEELSEEQKTPPRNF